MKYFANQSNILFHVGAYEDKNFVPIKGLQAQNIAGATIVNSNIQAFVQIDSFTVCIYSCDTIGYREILNVGYTISDEVKKEFSTLKEKDIIVFKNIHLRRSDRTRFILNPVVLFMIE